MAQHDDRTFLNFSYFAGFGYAFIYSLFHVKDFVTEISNAQFLHCLAVYVVS